MKRAARFAGISILTAACVLAGWKLWSLEKVTQGTVKSVEANQLVIVQAAKEGTNVWELTFEVNDNTKLNKIETIGNLAAGDQIKVKYQEKEEKYVATLVTKIEAGHPLDQRATL